MIAGSRAQGAVVYYGILEKDPQRIMKLINFPVMGIFATNDGHITREIVNDFKEKMEKASKELTVYFYEANHAFINSSNPKYNREAATDAYQKSLAFLKRVLD